jgi:PP-loop superfamily ATP-utilizing enzyme
MSDHPFKFVERCNHCLMPGHAVALLGNGCSYCCPEQRHPKSSVGKDLIPNDNQGMTIADMKALARSSTGKYDCLVGLSGGRDSTFLLYYTKKILKLNPLAVNFQSQFQTDEAKRNIRDATSRMEVDLVSYRIDRPFYQKLAKVFFVRFGEFCSPCHKGHHYTLGRCAAEHGIKLIIRGISSKIDLNHMNPDHFDFFCKSEAEFNQRLESVVGEFGISQQDLDENHAYLHFEATKDKSVLTIDLPDLLDWSYEQVQTVLDAEFNWSFPENQFFHCDCKMNPTLCYQEYCRHGFSEKQIIISNHLVGKDFSVQRGLELLASEEMPTPPENIDEVLALLDVDQTTFSAVIDEFWKEKGVQ